MFFAAFFGALCYARMMSVPWLAGEKVLTNEYLWKGFEGGWPTNGPGSLGGEFSTIPAWGIPFLNTCLLVASGFTFEMAHHALKEEKRTRCVAAMVATMTTRMASNLTLTGNSPKRRRELRRKLKRRPTRNWTAR